MSYDRARAPSRNCSDDNSRHLQHLHYTPLLTSCVQVLHLSTKPVLDAACPYHQLERYTLDAIRVTRKPISARIEYLEEMARSAQQEPTV